MNTHFDATVAYWDEVYRSGQLQGVIYQRRQAGVLEYVDAAGLAPSARVLEIGCGAGHLTLALAERGLCVHAVDASPAMVELAAGQARAAGLDGQVEVSPADAHALPFEDGQFELVVAVGVIPWLHSPREAVAEMARVLRAGGHVVLTADNGARLTSFTDPRGMLALTPLRRVYHRLRNRPAQAVSYLYFPRLIDRLARQAGLRPVARRTIGFGPLSFMAAHSSASNTGCGSTTACRRLPTPAFRGCGGAAGTTCCEHTRTSRAIRRRLELSAARARLSCPGVKEAALLQGSPPVPARSAIRPRR